jgi:peptidoglycan lytic transglycosylase G
MSNVGLQMSPESRVPQGPKHRGMSWIAILLSLGVLALIAVGAKFAIENLPSFGGPPDYVGEGTEPVVVTVEEGDTLAEIGQTLKADGVVASVDAWLAEAKKEKKTSTIGPGQYDMRKEMSAEAAVARMVDPQTRITNTLLLREGLRIDQTFDAIKQATGLSIRKLTKAAEGGEIGLPAYAKDNAEGFLFPATYELEDGESATQVLSRLVQRWDEAAATVDLEAGAKKLGYTPYEIMVIASLVQSEGHPDDFDKVARVIYNRLDPDTWGGTYGFLQMDATVNYALKTSEINLSTDQIQNTDSPYNTYLNDGLPPTPINSPGEAAMAAALNPADGDWLYYVTVNPDTGETKFTANYDEFLSFRAELEKWYAENGAR